MMNSDKVYWHQYISEYERVVFSKLQDPKVILEYGVLNGASVAWLAERFPTATIIGVDIIEEQKTWPHEDRIKYLQMDQGTFKNNTTFLAKVLNHGLIDLCIEDGSHDPLHQVKTLLYTIQVIKHGGWYILEDAHTSHPSLHDRPTIVHTLLAIQHLKRTKQTFTNKMIQSLESSLITQAEIVYFWDHITEIHSYKRSALPLWCYRCGESDFDYAQLQCQCGAALYAEADSMAFMIKFGIIKVRYI